jgi:hypothetical protein
MEDNSPSFLSPIAVLMFFIAGLLDLGGVICLILSITIVLAPIGLVLSVILDIAGLIIFGIWTLMRSGQIKGKSAKILKRLLKRSVLPTLVESIPIFGDIAASWIVTVYLTIKNDN